MCGSSHKPLYLPEITPPLVRVSSVVSGSPQVLAVVPVMVFFFVCRGLAVVRAQLMVVGGPHLAGGGFPEGASNRFRPL